MSGDNPLQKLKSVDWRGLVKSATNKVKKYAMNLSDLEIKVEDATNMDTWGPHGSAMSGSFSGIFFFVSALPALPCAANCSNSNIIGVHIAVS
jgi:hypothetical protein